MPRDLRRTTALDDLIRPWQLAAFLFALAVTGMYAAVPARMDAQAEAFVVVATSLDTPLLAPVVATLTRDPDVEETVIAGAPTTLARPGGGGPWPALVVVNGATEQGRRHPALQRLARGLARAGYLVLLPELPGLRRGELTDRTVQGTIDVAVAASAHPDAADGRVGLVGVSVGTSLALLAAEDPALAGRVSVVTGTAPYAELANLVRLATTGYYRDRNLLVPYEVDPFLAVAVARSLADALGPGPDRELVLTAVAAMDDDSVDPLAPVRSIPVDGLSAETRSVVELLANRDPLQFDELYAATPAELRAGLEQLSPLTAAERLTVPVELAVAPRDPYVPQAEAYALARAAPEVRVTVTATLGHAIPEPALDDLGDLRRFNRWVVRSLEAAAG